MIRYFLWLVLVVGAFGQDGSITVTVRRPLVLPVEQVTFVLNVTGTGDETLEDVLKALGDLGLRSEDLLGITVPQVAAKQGPPVVPFVLTLYQFRLTVPVAERASAMAKIDALKAQVSVVSSTMGATDATRERLRNALYPELMASARASAEAQAAESGRRLMGVTMVREEGFIPALLPGLGPLMRAGDFSSSPVGGPEQVGITVQFQSR